MFREKCKCKCRAEILSCSSASNLKQSGKYTYLKVRINSNVFLQIILERIQKGCQETQTGSARITGDFWQKAQSPRGSRNHILKYWEHEKEKSNQTKHWQILEVSMASLEFKINAAYDVPIKLIADQFRVEMQPRRCPMRMPKSTAWEGLSGASPNPNPCRRWRHRRRSLKSAEGRKIKRSTLDIILTLTILHLRKPLTSPERSKFHTSFSFLRFPS